MPRWRIVRLQTVASTMTEALGRPPGTVVLAEEQTAGQGRHGHSWHSERGSGLYCSLVLAASDPAPIVTLALGLAAKDAIENSAAVLCDLRWPNDVLIGGAKCAGILVQLHDRFIIAGIGINVNHTAFPEELAGWATSLRLATGRRHSRAKLLDRLLEAVDSYLPLDAEAILRLFAQSSSYVHGRHVVAEGIEGVTDGLDGNGFLRLRTAGGRRHLVRAGNVRPVGAPAVP